MFTTHWDGIKPILTLTDQQKRGMVETTSLKEKKLFFWRMTKVVKNLEESSEDLVFLDKDNGLSVFPNNH